jgi:hypothetical protein
MSTPSTTAFRVWLGWRAAALRETGGWDKFLGHLKSVFIPATWQVMPPFGLSAYLPSVFAEDQGDDWPDETALLVYAGTEGYEQRRPRSVAGRAYGLLHQAVFEFGKVRSSRSAWAAAWPERPAHDARVLAWYWPAAAAGPVLARADSAVVFLALGHADAPSIGADEVRQALDDVDGEVVVCRDGVMSFIWLATHGKPSAADVAAALQARRPDWRVHAAHDATGVPQPIDEEQGVALAAHQTLHFAMPIPAESAAV